MMKYKIFILVVLLAACSFAGVFLVKKSKENTERNSTPTNAAGQVLSVTVPEAIHLVEGEAKYFDYYVNSSSASVTVAMEDESVACLQDGNMIYALKSGNTVCRVSANLKEESVSKSTAIVVSEKQLVFTSLSENSCFMSGKKANNEYDTYHLKISANFSLKNKTIHLSDNIIISSSIFSSDYKEILVQYHLISPGDFEFLMEGFSFSNVAVSYISSLTLQFTNVAIENGKVTLYHLQEAKAVAYENSVYDYARLTSLSNQFDVIIEDSSILYYENQTFYCKMAGETMVTFKANDGSLFELSLTFEVKEIAAQECQISLSQDIDMTIGESVNIEISNFLPVYATQKSITLEVSENLSVNGFCVQSTAVGTGFIKVFLNGFLVQETIVQVNALPQASHEYTIQIVAPPSVEVDLENKQIKLPIGYVQIRIYVFDENSNLVPVTISITCGNTSATMEGYTVNINMVNNSTLRIYVDENTSYDFALIV